jgi:hypothetical protein
MHEYFDVNDAHELGKILDRRVSRVSHRRSTMAHTDGDDDDDNNDDDDDDDDDIDANNDGRGERDCAQGERSPPPSVAPTIEAGDFVGSSDLKRAGRVYLAVDDSTAPAAEYDIITASAD